MEFATDDTIVAIATPPGRGGIGVVRISGPTASATAQHLLNRTEPLAARHATFARLAGQTFSGSPIADEVIATYFQAPHSYTGQDVVEISAHGSPVVLNAIVQAAIARGARLAAPGEFTLRAFLGGKRDLVQAEAVGDLIAAATPLQARVAFDQLEGTLTRRIGDIDALLFDLIARLEASLDFPDEGYHFVAPEAAATEIGQVISHMDCLLGDAERGRMIREGATVVLVGRPNVGKSSLFNRLVGAERAIVTPIAGTTRDLVSEVTDIKGLAVTVVDTAGWRESHDVVEREGVMRGERARAVADVTVVVLDGSAPLEVEDQQLLAATSSQRRVVAVNKSDLPRTDRFPKSGLGDAGVTAVSATTGEGVELLREAISTTLTSRESLRDTATISNTRHIALLRDARRHLAVAQQAAAIDKAPEEFLLTDLQAARAKLDEIVGVRTPEDVLKHIFEHFCIGK